MELSAIYVRDFDYVWRSVRRLGVPDRDLPDVTHDVFVAVFRSLATFDPSRELRPWLFGVAVRVVSDYSRLARNKREALGLQREVIDSTPAPFETAERRETARFLDQLLATLDLPHRAVLVMHDFEGYRGREIAETLGIHFKTVYSRLHTARARIVRAADEQSTAERRTSRRRAPELLEEPLDASLDRQVGGVGALAPLLAFGGLGR
jgi:RNA polymerase sigma-70 factor (ECF subfamily)